MSNDGEMSSMSTAAGTIGCIPHSRSFLELVDSCGKLNLPIFIFYIVADLIALFLNNLLTLLASKLRGKQACTILLIAFSLANLVKLIVTVFSHFHNLYLLMYNDDESAMTPLGCVARKPEMLVNLFCRDLAALIVLCMSVERLTWISRLKIHSRLFTPKRTKVACTATLVLSGTKLLVCLLNIAKSSSFLRPSQCSLRSLISGWLYRNIMYWNLSLNYFIGIIYLIAYLVYRYRKRTARTQLQGLQVKRDGAYTRSLAIIMLLTVALQVVPKSLILISNGNEERKLFFGNLLAILKHILWVSTPLIYFCSNPDIKEQFCKLLASSKWLKNRMGQQSTVVYIG